MSRTHSYPVSTVWTGNRGSGTPDYRAYDRNHVLQVPGKPAIEGSADPAFRGDSGRWNPEELFVAALSACHMLWYLHLCASAGINVTAYADDALGEMREEGEQGGRFTRVELRPRVTLDPGANREQALALHALAHEKCFVARSVNCAVEVRPTLSS